MTPAQLDWEVSIEWERDAWDLDYVRESVATTRTKDGEPPSWHGDELVGWAVLHPNTPKLLHPASIHYRRYWWLRESDRPLDRDGPFGSDCPTEAVNPRSVEPGVESRLPAGARPRRPPRRQA